MIDDMTRKEFEALPFREDWGKSDDFDALIILPTRRIHDSGYRCLDFIGVRKNVAVCRLSGCSDVIHFDGIGGYRIGWPGREGLTQGHWNIDCLKKSGLLRIWTDTGPTRAGSALSSFEIHAVMK